MKGAAGQNVKGWRIPALKIEHNLAAALAGILNDRAAIVRDLDRNLDAAKIQSILETTAQWSARVRAEEERANALASLIDRAEVADDGIGLSIRVPPQDSGEPSTAASSFFSLCLPTQRKVAAAGRKSLPKNRGWPWGAARRGR